MWVRGLEYSGPYPGTFLMEVFRMIHRGLRLPTRTARGQWWIGLTTAGMLVSVAMLVFSWMLSVALLVTSSRLFEAVFALP